MNLKEYNSLFFEPKKFFVKANKEKDYLRPLVFYAMIFLAYYLLDFLLGLIFNIKLAASNLEIVAGLIFFLLNCVVVWSLPFVQGAAGHMGLLVFGSKQSYFKSFKSIGYSTTVIVPYLSLASVVFGLPSIILGFYYTSVFLEALVLGIIIIGLIHTLYVLVIGTSMLHKLTKQRSLLGLLLLPLILGLALIIAFSLL